MNSLHVGESGVGSVEIVNGGQVLGVGSAVPFIAYLGYGVGSTGSLIVDGVGSLWSSDTLYVGRAGGGSGVLSVSNGGQVAATNVHVFQLGEVRGDSEIEADVRNFGLVSPGTSAGSLKIDGDYTQMATGKLLIELASASYDQLLVTGDVTLAGTLTVNLIASFIPSPGQAFTILTADDVVGTFTTEMLPSVPNLTFDVIYNSQSVVLTVLSALPGDYNGNGTVDAADYTVWRNHLGSVLRCPTTTQPAVDDWTTTAGRCTTAKPSAADQVPLQPSPSPLRFRSRSSSAGSLCLCTAHAPFIRPPPADPRPLPRHSGVAKKRPRHVSVHLLR